MRDLYDGQVCLLMALLQEKQNWTLQTNPLRKKQVNWGAGSLQLLLKKCRSYCVVWHSPAACMLPIAIHDVEILAARLFTVGLCFNVYARWRQRLWFKRWKDWDM